MLPALFVSHGAPTFALTQAPAHFPENLASELPDRPQATLVASAHWETARPTVNAVEVNATIHDFLRGFPKSCTTLPTLHHGHRNSPVVSNT